MGASPNVGWFLLTARGIAHAPKSGPRGFGGKAQWQPCDEDDTVQEAAIEAQSLSLRLPWLWLWLWFSLSCNTPYQAGPGPESNEYREFVDGYEKGSESAMQIVRPAIGAYPVGTPDKTVLCCTGAATQGP